MINSLELNYEHDEAHYHIARKRMVREQLIARGIQNEAILNSFLNLPRHLFLEHAMRVRAHDDAPVHIGYGATISQPYIVAYCLERLNLKSHHKVLEIGTGCGYQTALLAQLVEQVCSIEFVRPLFFKARQNLKALQFKNIILKLGDGSQGWLEQAPYDAMVVAAGSPDIPKPLVNQLKVGGRLILPVGPNERQDLVLVTKTIDGFNREKLLSTRFVDLKGKHGH